ncbi:lytic transglycosylase domain-containing protein [Azorhizobium oxalatiphilum]|uniref:lytic transglycosylase domain-containing protein n=1 Tax=Azorhizobium oxalatiphilum TaxID=980631 RepID=UPI00166784EC|nr:lytic transglycosylase domain-containing protein [Azorhizobium oxalatiphilum]
MTRPAFAASGDSSSTTDSKPGSKAKKAEAKPVPKPNAKPAAHKDAKGKDAKAKDTKAAAQAKSNVKSAGLPPRPAPKTAPLTLAPTAGVSTGELSELRSAVTAAKNGRGTEALAQARQMSDPVARTLVTWLVIRHAPNDYGFDNIAAFLRDKPGWPTPGTLRRRAERVLLQENRDPATVRAFFADQNPVSGEGKIALAKAFAASGDRNTTTALVRDAWRNDELTESFENQVLGDFGVLLTRADHKARADRFSYKPDQARALRAAARAGSDVVALTQARLAIAKRAPEGSRLLAQVPFTLSSDPAYLFAKSQLARRAEKDQEAAAALLQAASKDADALVDTDEWWIERRLVSRELLETGDFRTAYKVAANGPAPEADNYRAEQQFTAGWIALAFLKDTRAAQAHFSRIAHGQKNPITLSRAAFWLGRASEAAGDTGTARSHYQQAAQYSTTYYGQLARQRLGAAPVALRHAPEAGGSARATFDRIEPVKAVRLLYAIGERDIAMTVLYDLAWRMEDSSQLQMLYTLAQQNNDARGALVVGKEAVAEGHPLDQAAFPTFGLPAYTSIGNPVDRAMVYAIARQESQFNPRTLSSAQAMGLMQVTPAAGREVTKKTGVPYDESRLMNDQSYNVQFGAAELGELMENYGGNTVLVFAAYNAGRGSVRKWIERFGDPRSPDIDPVDWVELIPFSETRNYVQRVSENYNAYRARFGTDRNQPVAAR